MAVVRSTWADQPIVVGKHLDSPGWAGAAELALDGVGSVLIKNDARHLYVGIDVVADWDADDDFFWLGVDADRDGTVTPNRDRLYGPWPDRPGVVGKQYYLGPTTFTHLLDTDPECEAYAGFGPSAANPSPHRTWTMRLPLRELDVALAAERVPPVVHVGFRIGSVNPPVDHSSIDFADGHRLVLATRPSSTYPPGTEGAVIGGIGLIPATTIDGDGRATTAPGYSVVVTDAAFGGSLNVIGNRATLQYLWALGARRHRVLHRAPGAATSQPLRQAWINYRWDGNTDHPESYSPDASGAYAMLDPSANYSIDSLLVRWDTSSGQPAGLHTLEAEFLRDDGSAVAPPVAAPLTLRLANAGPRVVLDSVRGADGEVRACGSVPAGQALDFDLTAVDSEAGLASYSLVARWGEGQLHVIGGAPYTPPGPWNGGSFTHRWTPAQPCAYAFEVAASSRVTDGYNPSIRGGRASRFVTIAGTRP